MGGSLHSFPSCSHPPAHAQPEEAQKRCSTKRGAEGMMPYSSLLQGRWASLQRHSLTRSCLGTEGAWLSQARQCWVASLWVTWEATRSTGRAAWWLGLSLE